MNKALSHALRPDGAPGDLGFRCAHADLGFPEQRVGGVVRSELKDKLSRMLFRVSRGNALAVFNEIEEPMLEGAEHTAAAVSKHAFVVVVSSEVLERKVLKVMEAFDANRCVRASCS